MFSSGIFERIAAFAEIIFLNKRKKKTFKNEVF